MNSNTSQLTSATIQPYLFFGGRCEEALAFYRTALGAQIIMTMRFSESPQPLPPGVLQPGFENKVMHCRFRIGETTVMASDGSDDKSRFGGFSPALSVQDDADADRVFAFLSAATWKNLLVPAIRHADRPIRHWLEGDGARPAQ